MQMIGCSILSALMAEYATTVKSSDVGLAWEIHFKAKKQFELTDLKSIFQFCVQALKELTPTLTIPIPPERSNLVLRLSTLAEHILSWSFISITLPKKLISVFEADQNPSLRPGASWKDVILNPEIPKLFFEVSIYRIISCYKLRSIISHSLILNITHISTSTTIFLCIFDSL